MNESAAGAAAPIVGKNLLKPFYVLKKDGKYFTGMGARRGFFAHAVGMSYSLTSLAEIRHEQSVVGGDVIEATPLSTAILCKYAERIVPPDEVEPVAAAEAPESPQSAVPPGRSRSAGDHEVTRPRGGIPSV